jgi:hypothetical protein
MVQGSLGFRVYHFDNWGSADLFIGPKFEFVQHKWSDVPWLDHHSDFGNDFSVGFNGKMAYDRRERNYGAFMQVFYGINTRISFIAGGSLGVGNQAARYDPDESEEITWYSAVPTNWSTGFFHRTAYFRFNFSLRFRLI